MVAAAALALTVTACGAEERVPASKHAQPPGDWDAGDSTAGPLVAGDAAAEGGAVECPVPEPSTPFEKISICGCTLSGSVSMLGQAVVDVTFTNQYAPRCLAVSPQTTVRWTGDFLAHPLWPSACSGNVAANPIRDVADPSQPKLEVEFGQPGTFPYYCPYHASDGPSPSGMCGVIYVVP